MNITDTRRIYSFVCNNNNDNLILLLQLEVCWSTLYAISLYRILESLLLTLKKLLQT